MPCKDALQMSAKTEPHCPCENGTPLRLSNFLLHHQMCHAKLSATPPYAPHTHATQKVPVSLALGSGVIVWWRSLVSGFVLVGLWFSSRVFVGYTKLQVLGFLAAGFSVR
ncbi:hypothetical protein VNO80_06428 [Phaseolus coccineus]|uniref:Uncharacterized protein n=1 Tax=Phaseolus coccineus TaxID=3886 RepID=A0AAN9NLR6_PHACN